MSVINATPLLAAAGGDYQISRSVRLRESAGAYLSRTFSSSGNQKTWTWSAWLKRGTSGRNRIFTTAGNSQDGCIRFENTDVVQIYFNGTTSANLLTSSVYRDFSAWYHIVVSVDTTQATASNRIKLYVNGAQVTSFSTANYPTLNYDTGFSAAAAHSLSSYVSGGGEYFGGYLTEVNFIDGQALTPSSFGETDAITGVWKPKKYAGTYGTNGFYLNFSDNSNNTAATIGKDSSGNGNNWTPNNISVTSGSTYDSMLDVPTNWPDGGNGRGNYAVLNRLDSPSPAGISNGNLSWYNAVASWQTTRATMAVSSGKWYWEVACSNVIIGSTYVMLGIDNFSLTIGSGYPGSSSTSYGYFSNDGKKFTNGAAGVAYGASYTNDLIGVALDLDAGTLVFYKNGVSQGTAYTGIVGTYVPAFGEWGSIIDVNFGQRPFAYTPPTGFKALNTQNLPAPTILKGNQYFDAKLYTGNGSTQSITGLGFAPDLVWTKARSSAISHGLFDTVRGAGKAVYSNATNAEYDYGTTTAGELYQFTSDGFNLGSSGNFNANGVTNVAWSWKESVSAGFDIVTYTGNGSNRTIAHSLGVAPSMVIVKKRTGTIGSGSSNWMVWHQSIAASQVMYLDQTSAVSTNASVFNSTAPTSSVFSLGTNTLTNENTGTFVAYLFAEVAGFSKFGSYTGNGSVDGPFVFCGFRPRFVMIKSIDNGGVGYDWIIYDTAREPTNVAQFDINANSSSAEGSGQLMDILSNGFKPRGNLTKTNFNGNRYVFAAFSESPFKHSLAR